MLPSPLSESSIPQRFLHSTKPGEVQALQGRLEPHHRFLLKETLAHLDFLQQRVGQLEQEVAERLSPFEKSITLLMTIPGISRRSATIIRIANSEQIWQRLRAQHSSLYGWGFVLEAI